MRHPRSPQAVLVQWIWATSLGPTSFQYKHFDQVPTIIDPIGGETTFTYDGNGNLLTLTDAREK